MRPKQKCALFCCTVPPPHHGPVLLLAAPAGQCETRPTTEVEAWKLDYLAEGILGNAAISVLCLHLLRVYTGRGNSWICLL